ncbi:MAG: hypothetical protein FK734_07330, partial [Asgard group archaeon]|nr:hypothetical protein [Asgard group archaeon]
MNKPLLNIDLFEWRVYTIKHVKDNQNIAFRIKKQVIILLLLVIINLVIIGLTSRSITLIEKNELDANATSGTVKEYSFLTLGIIIDPLEWSSKGTFELSINETFDFSNSGPAMLILDFSSEGDKPDSPGYELEGKFNLEIFDSVISRSILPSSGNGDVVRQIVIPFDAEGRVFSNQFTMTISCINDYSSNYEGLLLIHSSSKFVIGDVLLINDYGNYSAPVFPEKLEGTTSLGGIKLYSYFQFTIDNETIVSKADSKMSFVIEYTGDVSLSLVMFD